ncbi:MAG: glycosyltransferase [Prevotella sp.]|jgi:glycosyltransferase involved in cell wall biosynthesis|nr:glycosyltransferase [Prevotella sp.]
MVSVILPNYNHAPFLKQRIESILNQTHQDFELIILDDNSSDNSKEIIEEYRGNKHISKIVYNETNTGSPFRQWTKGISMAKGEYIWIAESDDYSEPTFLQQMMETITKQNAILGFCLSNVVDKEGNIKSKRTPVMETEALDNRTFTSRFLLFNNNIYNASSVIFKKSCVEKIDWTPIIQKRYSGDWLFWATLLLNNNGAVCEVKEHLNNYRMHDMNVSNNSQKKGLDFLEGFPISVHVADTLHIKRDSFFTQTWVHICRTYIRNFNIRKDIQIKIWVLFARLQPQVIPYILKQAINKILRK